MNKFLNSFSGIALTTAGCLLILQGNTINGLLMIVLAKQCFMENAILSLMDKQ